MIVVGSVLGSCQSNQSVDGVWREVTTLMTSQAESQPESAGIYELSLGQFGDRVTGVSVRYRPPISSELANYSRGDRCECSFVVQGLVKDIEDDPDEGLLFIARGLTFSLLTPDYSGDEVCPTLPKECQRIFDLEQVDGGEVLEGETWCLNSSDGQVKTLLRAIRFEKVSGLPETSCEAP